MISNGTSLIPSNTMKLENNNEEGNSMPGKSDFTKEELLIIEIDKHIKANNDLSIQHDFLKKKYSGLQEELNNTLEAQSKLEKQFYKLEAELDMSKQAEQESLRRGRDLETKLANELKAYEMDKTKFAQREEQLKEQVKNIHNQYKEKIANSNSPSRPTRTRSVSISFSPQNFTGLTELEEPSNDPSDRTEASLLHENKIANRTIRQQLKDIGELKAQLNQLNELFKNEKDQNTQQIKLLKEEVQNLTLANSKLMEDNESYQFLLQEKTLKGQFTLNQFDSTPRLAEHSPNTFNLGIELDKFDSDNEDKESIINFNEIPNKQQKDEMRLLKDENKALALYINKILAKIMSNPVLADAITNSGDPISMKDTRETIKEQSVKAPAPKEAPKPSRFSFFSPTFTAQTPPTNLSVTANSANPGRVSFDLPKPNRELIKPNRNSTDSIDLSKDTLNMKKEENKPEKVTSFRTRRAKSMSVNNVPDQFNDNNNLQSPSTIFSFKTAFKRIATPWKSTNNNTNKSGSESENEPNKDIPEIKVVVEEPIKE